MDDKHSIFQEIQQLIVDRFGVREDDVTEAMTFSDLGADSLDIVELVMEIENKYNIQFSDESIAEIKSIGQAVKLIEGLK